MMIVHGSGHRGEDGLVDEGEKGGREVEKECHGLRRAMDIARRECRDGYSQSVRKWLCKSLDILP